MWTAVPNYAGLKWSGEIFRIGACMEGAGWGFNGVIDFDLCHTIGEVKTSQVKFHCNSYESCPQSTWKLIFHG